MAAGRPALKWNLAEAMRRYPESTAVFARLRMACPGCVMAPFETLGEAAEIYNLEPDFLLKAIRQVCVPSRKGRR
ncbi:MAG: DUF1858 domain-containing protein [Planctomycetes bacterium]|nr:DUF1858 domain-containing protein [Planctomycetota bacterium]